MLVGLETDVAILRHTLDDVCVVSHSLMSDFRGHWNGSVPVLSDFMLKGNSHCRIFRICDSVFVGFLIFFIFSFLSHYMKVLIYFISFTAREDDYKW